MMLVLNRLRGTQGLWSKIIGLLLALATLIAFNNTYVAPLYFVADAYIVTLAIVLLSASFPLACELGYRTAPLFNFEYKTFSIKGGWEHQEIWYGLIQYLVLITLGVTYGLS